MLEWSLLSLSSVHSNVSEWGYRKNIKGLIKWASNSIVRVAALRQFVQTPRSLLPSTTASDISLSPVVSNGVQSFTYLQRSLYQQGNTI